MKPILISVKTDSTVVDLNAAFLERMERHPDSTEDQPLSRIWMAFDEVPLHVHQTVPELRKLIADAVTNAG